MLLRFIATAMIAALLALPAAADDVSSGSKAPKPPLEPRNGNFVRTIPLDVPAFRGLEPALRLMGMDGIGVIPKDGAEILARLAAITKVSMAAAVAARLEEHHLLPRQLEKIANIKSALKELGVNLESSGNKVRALQNGGTMGHRAHNANVIRNVGDIVARYGQGQITKQQALKELAAVRSSLRKSLREDPGRLATKKDTSTTTSSKSERSGGNASNKSGSSRDKDGRGPRI